MAKRNTKGMTSKAKEKTPITEAKVLKEIDRMEKVGEAVSRNAIHENTGVSRSFMYNNEKVRAIIDEKKEKAVKAEKSYDTRITALKIKLRQQEVQINELKKCVKYKEMYDQCKDENDVLKKQLLSAYKY